MQIILVKCQKGNNLGFVTKQNGFKSNIPTIPQIERNFSMDPNISSHLVSRDSNCPSALCTKLSLQRCWYNKQPQGTVSSTRVKGKFAYNFVGRERGVPSRAKGRHPNLQSIPFSLSSWFFMCRFLILFISFDKN